MTPDQVGRESAPRKKSTAARKDVPVQKPKRAALRKEASADVTRVNTAAGTQALPVDTIPVRGAEFLKDDAATAAVSDKAEQESATPPTGAKFDKKAWMRDYMREYMRKRRAK